MITYNSLYFTKDNEPFFPVMGEYQYSRNDNRYWRTGIAKMKATGINTIASYVIWIHHEEIKGQINFTKNNNLRKFVSLIKENNMMMCLRIGPWVHAEARNGGFPDWIYKENINLRSNDEKYLFYVKRFFKKLYLQCKGLLYKDGGPIFAIQIENEYSQWGRQGKEIGDEHINKLIDILKEIGFDVPVYFATGWGQAAIGKAIPVWGAYCEAPWEYTIEKLPPFDAYLFSANPNDENIGSDTGKKKMDIDILKKQYPFATVELGAGIQVTKIRRPIIKGSDNAAIALCKLGSGCGAIGYYTYHGGIHPTGKLTSMQEYRDETTLAPGFCCDLPEKDYDFQGAISQYGKIHDSGRELKLINYFIEAFKDDIAKKGAFIYNDNASDANDSNSLRYAIRKDDNSAFFFVNNYVRQYDLPSKYIKNFKFSFNNKEITFPNITIKNKEYDIFPINYKINDKVINYATASLFTKLNNKDYFFVKSNELSIIDSDYTNGLLFILSKEEALNAYKFNIGNVEYLFINDDDMYQIKDNIFIEASNVSSFKVYPNLKIKPKGYKKIKNDRIFTIYQKEFKENVVTYTIEAQKLSNKTIYEINLNYQKKSSLIYMQISYSGNSCNLFINNVKENDNFYTGIPFEIELSYYNYPSKIVLEINEMKKNDFVYYEKPLKFVNNKACSLDKINFEIKYKTKL